MRKLFIVSVITLCALATYGQNIQTEEQKVSFYSYPLKPLDNSIKTYSALLRDAAVELTASQKEELLSKGLVLPGYEKIATAGDLQIELIFLPLKVVEKQVKDAPYTVEKDGVKNTTHNYSFEVVYLFPTKVKLVTGGKTMIEHELPSRFTDKFYSMGQVNSPQELQKAYDDNYGKTFEADLFEKRVTARVKEVSAWLASSYGRGPIEQTVWLGYVKNNKGEYDDLKNAFTSLKDAFALAGAKEYWLNETYKTKVKDAVTLWEKALTESSEDKKARIDTKVTGLIYYNLAAASYALNDVDKSDEWLTKVTKKASGDIEASAALLKDLVKDRRARLVANGFISGPAVTEQPVAQQEAAPVAAPEISQKSYLISPKGDTLHFTFKMPSLYDMAWGDSVWLQDQVVIWEKGKETTVTPENALGYYYKGVYRESLTWTKDMTTSPWTFEKKFCKRILHGAIDMYERYDVKPAFNNPDKMICVKSTWYRYNKKSEAVLEAGWLNFNKGVAKLVADYPALSERVRGGEFSNKEFMKVATEYNAWAAQQPAK